MFRFGMENRPLRKGLNWLIPFYIEKVATEVTYRRPVVLESQSLTTVDDIGVVITPIVTFQVMDARKLILESGGSEEAILSTVSGIVADHVTESAWEDLNTDEFREGVLESATELCDEYGLAILNITWKDLVRTRTYRIVQESNHK